MKMLPCRARLRIRVLIVLALCQVSASTKPIISPSEQQIVINEGEPLEISCTGSTPIKFLYPDEIGIWVNTSTPKKSNDEENGVYKYVFQRPKTVFGDTGWYGCAEHNYDSEVNWLYVFVKSDTNLFVEVHTLFYLKALFGSSVVIPCRTTSPDLVPILSVEGDELDPASFDPRSGFTVRNPLSTVKHNYLYSCSIEKDGKKHYLYYFLSLKRTLHERKIQVDDDPSLLYVTRGQDLYVNCTVEMEMAMRYVFDWKTPQQNSSRRSTQQFRKRLDGNTVQVTCQLTILNVTDEDGGEYECFIRSVHDTKKITTNITIHDPGKNYINLRPQHSDRYYQIEKGSDVEWVVYVDGYPKPHLQWSMNGWKICVGPKYFMNINATATILKIISLDLRDTGNYSLEAKNGFMIEKLNFTLDVIAKSVPTINVYYSQYYLFNESCNFYCRVTANPAPNITLSFTRYPNYPSLTDSTEVHLTSVMRAASIYNSYDYESTAKMSIKVSGKITCTACNILNCDSVTGNIFVSDGVRAFGIIKPKELVTKGDNVELTCAASIYKYTDELAWSIKVNRTEEPLIETERLQIVRHKTQFTYRSTLKLNNVQKSDAKVYICRGKINNTTDQKDFLSKYADYKLVIHVPGERYINLRPQHSDRYYQVENGSYVEWVVYVDGYPKPHLQWSKNDWKIFVAQEGPKYFMNINATATILKIISLNIWDTGNYTLKAINDYTIKKLNFTLDVIAKPVPTLPVIFPYYSFNKSRNFDCEVIANPAPNITWSFTRCPNYPSLTDSTEVHLTSVMPRPYYPHKFKSTATMSIEVSGKITCTACNIFNCSSVTENILVSDGYRGFDIIGPKEPVTKGNNVELTCAASIYNYTDEFAWSIRVNQTEEPLIETERLQIMRHKTPFTYRSTLKLNNVQKSDANVYICTGKITIDRNVYRILSEYADYKLVIHDPVPPFFTKTNVNETKIITIDENAEGHKTVILQCFARGIPVPTVTWYKDNVLLKENDQYFFKYNYQELNIKYLKQNDSGKYSCRAISRLGTNETYQQITVKNAVGII